MIENLPEKITLDQLLRFNFGNIEANDDNLLFDSICKTAAIVEFLNGDKNIIIGEKGTGKTALFRILKDRKLAFHTNNGNRNLILPIDDNFQYKHIKSKILKLIQTDLEEDYFKFQVVWEIFIFHKSINFISGKFTDLPKSLKKANEISNKIFGKSSSSLGDFFKNAKRTFGVKLYNTPTGFILPDIYATTEPSENSSKKETDVDKLEIDLDFYKTELSKYLNQKECKLIVLIDRLDEFVSKTDLPDQIEMLEALISVEREYNRYPGIELKIFLRDDLFKHLSFEGIGYDKVINKKTELKWPPDKIREFIARRIIYNFAHIFEMKGIQVSVDHEKLELETSDDIEAYKSPNFVQRICRSLIKKYNPHHYAQKFARKASLTDDINKQIILTIFPKYVEHINNEGKTVEIDIFDYFGSHFNLGTGNSIPRLYIIFLNKCFEILKNYYKDNFDELPILDKKSKYFALFKKGFFSRAYKEFQSEVYINFAKLNKEFETNIMLLKEKKGHRTVFRAKELKGLLNIEDADLELFCDYLVHIGLFKEIRKSVDLELQKYEIPILFRV